MKIFVVGGTPEQTGSGDEHSALGRVGTALGKVLAIGGHEIVACSPFPDSLDYHVIAGGADAGARVEIHYPDAPSVASQISQLVARYPKLDVQRRRHAPPEADSQEAMRNAWLFAQLAAMEASDLVVAIGGKSGGSASLLLRIANDRRRALLPFSFLGGAARGSFDRSSYELSDRLGSAVELLWSEEGVARLGELVPRMLVPRPPDASRGTRGHDAVFFISYPRARAPAADVVEMHLRRRGFVVLRDEHDFAAGEEVSQAIREAIHRATVFVATWCAEYACSPHCYDELELAIDRKASGKMSLWILDLDGTRMVPPRARQLLRHPAHSRQELEGIVLRMIEDVLAT
jgi:hypothetical protein